MKPIEFRLFGYNRNESSVGSIEGVMNLVRALNTSSILRINYTVAT